MHFFAFFAFFASFAFPPDDKEAVMVREREGAVRALLADVGTFSRAVWPEYALRAYQAPAARGIARLVAAGRGGVGVVVMARQSGKDELLAQTVAYLLVRHQRRGGEIVFATPSLDTQGELSSDRVWERLQAAGPLAPDIARSGHHIRCGRAGIRYLSAGPQANARGATASLLLVGNEAQDIARDRWDAVFDPMGAATNAPTVFSGTVWTADTLLARETARVEAARAEAAEDVAMEGTAHLWQADWEAVAQSVPAYGERVRARIAAVGADDPFVRTEYRLLPLAGAGRLLDAGRLMQMHGTHPRIRAAVAGRTYALLVDVGGGDESGEHRAPDDISNEAGGRDSTVLTVVEIVSGAHPGSPGGDEPETDPAYPFNTPTLPTYQVVDRRVWTGAGHVALAAEIGDLARRVWRAARVVVDATGIGHGLAAMLAASLPAGVVTPYVFTAPGKSALGWWLLAAAASGRYREYADDGAADTRAFWAQAGAAAYTVRPGPARLMQWSVPERSGHDDLLLSAALTGTLDDLDWSPRIAVGRYSRFDSHLIRGRE